MPGQVTMTVAEYQAYQRQQAGLTPQPRPAGGLSPLPRDVETLLTALQQLAKRAHWVSLNTYGRDGGERGIECVLVRDVTIFAELPVGPLTPAALQWIERLRATTAVTRGVVEVYIWRLTDLPTITERLQRRPSHA
jgi:hypothetical protein